jgi:hypothetical protein
VLSSSESRTNAVHYSPAARTITLVVYRERTAQNASPPLDLGDEGEDLGALSRGALPPERPQKLEALRFRLREGAGPGQSRGMIVEGSRIDATIREVDFLPDPTRVMSATITYHKP